MELVMKYASQIKFILLQYSNNVCTIVPCTEYSVVKLTQEISEIIISTQTKEGYDIAERISSRLHYWCETFQMLVAPVRNIGESMYMYIPYPYCATTPKEQCSDVLKLYPDFINENETEEEI